MIACTATIFYVITYHQLLIRLILGILFGFLLQKGGVPCYDFSMGQLPLTDFTALKIMLSAVVVGMTGIYAMKGRDWIELHPKPGSVGASLRCGICRSPRIWSCRCP